MALKQLSRHTATHRKLRWSILSSALTEHFLKFRPVPDTHVENKGHEDKRQETDDKENINESCFTLHWILPLCLFVTKSSCFEQMEPGLTLLSELCLLQEQEQQWTGGAHVLCVGVSQR